MRNRPTTRISALLATARIANAPSVASHVWIGLMMGALGHGGTWGEIRDHGPSDLRHAAGAALLGLGCVCIYLGGNFLNDWADRHWDAKRRPERALPSGMFSPGAYLTTALCLFLAGLGAAFGATVGLAPTWFTGLVPGGVCLAIVGLVFLYTWLHKRHPGAVVFVAACRGLLVWAGFYFAQVTCTGCGWFHPAPGSCTTCLNPLIPSAVALLHSGALFAWVAGLSLAARHESVGEHPPAFSRIGSRILLLAPFLGAPVWFWLSPAVFLSVLPLAVWLALASTRWKSPPKRHVGALLAGLPLIDFIPALPLAFLLLPERTPFFAEPMAIACAAVPLAAFLAGLLLQRLAPAT